MAIAVKVCVVEHESHNNADSESVSTSTMALSMKHNVPLAELREASGLRINSLLALQDAIAHVTK